MVLQRLREMTSRNQLWHEPWQFLFRRFPMLVFAIFFLSGVGACGWLGKAYFGQVCGVMVSFIILALAAYLMERKAIALGFGAGAIFAVGLAYGIFREPPSSDGLSPIATEHWQPCAIRVEIAGAVIWRPNQNFRPNQSNEVWRSQWTVRCLAIRDQMQWMPVDAYSTLTIDGKIEDILPGDIVEVAGELRKITPPTNPGSFDFSAHAKLEHQFVSLRAASNKQVSHVDSSWSSYPFERARAKAILAIDRWLYRWVSPEQAPLAAALVFGQRHQIDWEQQQELIATGTMHMLSISGLHVEMLASFIVLGCVIASFKNRTIFFCLVPMVWAYAFLVGAQPPVIRAAIQISIFTFANWIGGRARLGNLLGLSAVAIVLWRPASMTNVGVQLSFLAVAIIGIFVIGRTKEQSKRDRLQAVVDESLPLWRFWILGFMRRIVQAALLSFWVSLFTCPLIWNTFHVVSPIAIVLNILISIPLLVSLISGLVVGLLGWIPPVGWFAGGLCSVSLAIVSSLVSLGNDVPYGHFWLPAPPLWWTFVFYAIGFIWLLAFGRQKIGWLALLLVSWVGVGVLPWIAGPRSMVYQAKPIFAIAAENQPELRCTFLNVGHGTCVVLELPTGEVWLYDAGHIGASERSHEEIAASLWELPTARIDRLIISHADSDHYNAVGGLLDRFFIGSIVSTPQFWLSRDPDVEKLFQLIDRHGVSRESWSHPTHLEESYVKFQVLHPTNLWRGGSDNAESLCLQIEFEGIRVLLPGDLEGPGIMELVELPTRPCQILMAPHHGSTSLQPDRLLEWCQPKVVVISGGRRAIRPEVTRMYSPIAEQVAITYRDGAVQVRIRDGKATLFHWKFDHWEDFQ